MLLLSDFKTQVQHLDGVRLETGAERRGFIVTVRTDGVEYIPESSGIPRPDTWDRIGSVIDRFNETWSNQPRDYQDLTHHASYVLAILAHLLGKDGGPTDASG
ncbi:MAG: hypothetical protein MUO50_13975, partial [Longimicrobiales bacterium]|nr:hypothetical protein [Longimicrobiales bacterium]